MIKLEQEVTMRIYHGSYCAIRKPLIINSFKNKDFADGFYCTVIKEQAERWAKRYDTRVVSSYHFLIDEKLKILEFKEMNDQWLDFIASCRSGKKHSYDIVIGPMADDQIYNYVFDFLEGNISRGQFWTLAKFKYPTNQICFCSENSLSCIKFIESYEVK